VRGAPAGGLEWPDGDLVVVSPHFDDAAFSLGGTIAALSRAGRRVRVLTVFGGDPESSAPSDEWAARTDFATEGEEVQARRAEDERACAILGAEAVWLSFSERTPAEEIAGAVRARLEGAGAVVVPGFPCTHTDHLEAARAVLSAPPSGARLGLYVEQPYAMWRLLSERPAVGNRRQNLASLALRRPRTARLQRPVPPPGLTELVQEPADWRALPVTARDRAAKCRAIAAYTSQMRVLSKFVYLGIGLYERQWGGEAVALLSSRA